MHSLRKGIVFLITLIILTGCPKLIPGTMIRIEDVDVACRDATFNVLAFQGNQAIGHFEMTVNMRYEAEFVIPRAVAQRVDFNQPVKLTISLKRGPQGCFLAGRLLIFTGTLTQRGTDPRTGNPVYVLDFWKDFKVEYR